MSGASELSDYAIPVDLPAALEMKAAGRAVLAGGTDFYPVRVERPLTEPVVDITALEELRGITRSAEGTRLGALTRWAEVAAADLPRRFDGLRAAAREVGAVQVQNQGTIGGNLCNASPAADGVPVLLALDASVELTSPSGRRVLPLERFITGYRQTDLRQDELLTAVIVPAGGEDASSVFLKLGLRRYLVISVVMVAAILDVGSDGCIADARIAVGACSPVARRLTSLEADLLGRSVRDDPAAMARPEHLAPLAPIDDVRATAAYRLEAALALVRRAIASCTESP